MDAASGGIAVASIAIQLFDSIQKLCDFINTIRDVPANLQRIQDELQVVEVVLTSVDDSMTPEDRQNVDHPLFRSLEICRSTFEKLADTTRGWQMGLGVAGGRKTWTRLVAAFGKKKLAEFEMQIESAKTLVLLSLQPYYHQNLRLHLRQETALVIKMLQEMQLSSGNPMVQPSGGASRSPLPETLSCHDDSSCSKIVKYRRPRQTNYQTAHVEFSPRSVAWALTLVCKNMLPLSTGLSVLEGFCKARFPTFGAFLTTQTRLYHLQGVIEELDDDLLLGQYQTTIKIILPILKKGFQISVTGAMNSMIPTRLDFHAIIPYDSPSIRLCQEGNIRALLSAFREGRASIHDRTLHGSTLLHIASSHHQVELCKVLIESGADVYSQDSVGCTPIDLVLISLAAFRKDNPTPQIIKLLVEAGSFPNDFSFHPVYFSVANVLMWLLRQQYVPIPPANHIESPHWHVLQHLVHFGVRENHDQIKILLREDVSVHSHMKIDLYDTILETVVKYGGQENVDAWIQCLQSEGIDIPKYCKVEEDIHPKPWIQEVYCHRSSVQPFDGTILYNIQFHNHRHLTSRHSATTPKILVVEDGALHWFNWGAYDTFIFRDPGTSPPCEYHKYNGYLLDGGYRKDYAKQHVVKYYCNGCRSSSVDLCEGCYSERHSKSSRRRYQIEPCVVNGVFQPHNWVSYASHPKYALLNSTPPSQPTISSPAPPRTPSERALYHSLQVQNLCFNLLKHTFHFLDILQHISLHTWLFTLLIAVVAVFYPAIWSRGCG